MVVARMEKKIKIANEKEDNNKATAWISMILILFICRVLDDVKFLFSHDTNNHAKFFFGVFSEFSNIHFRNRSI